MAQHLLANAAQQQAQLTSYVTMYCAMAATGGLMYGYDLVVAGGVAVMDNFLALFYPDVLISKKNFKQDNYCRYKNDVFQLFASSLYIAALSGAFVASAITRRLGRTPSMLTAGLLFIAGTVIGTGAQNLGMLLVGRVLLGCGLGFSNQAVPLYLSEIAPPRVRGGLHYIFGLNVAVGILSGNIVNYLAAKIHPWGWRLSLGVAGIPAVFLIVFSLILVESPTSLIQRGHYDKAKSVLAKIRGSPVIEAEFQDLLHASLVSQRFQSRPCTNLLQRRNTPSLVMGIAFPFFQQVSGNDAILFYGAFLFKLAGFGDQAALYSAVIISLTTLLTSCATIALVDRLGRRPLLLIGSVFMLSSMVVLASIFAVDLPGNTQKLPRFESITEVVMVCVFMFAFSASLGPLAWLIPSEIYPLEVRPVGLSMTVCVNMLFKFVIAQTFLSMVCAFKYGVFLFFSGWVLVLFIFVALLLPETKGVPIDAMQHLWARHWFWKRIIGDDIAMEQSEGLSGECKT